MNEKNKLNEGQMEKQSGGRDPLGSTTTKWSYTYRVSNKNNFKSDISYIAEIISDVKMRTSISAEAEAELRKQMQEDAIKSPNGKSITVTIKTSKNTNASATQEIEVK